MPTLYITATGASVRREGNQLIAQLEDEVLATVPLEHLELVIVQGSNHISFDAIQVCLERGIPIAYLNYYGAFLGRLEPHSPATAHLQRSQLALVSDPVECCALSRLYVTAKLRNAQTVLRRWLEDENLVEHPVLKEIQHQAEVAREATDLDSLRGHEGHAAAIYFREMGRLLPEPWIFEHRRAHPSPDPVNAMLSFGYTLLYNLMLGAIRAAGLNPYLACFHADREGHATLASDLMEEWRPILVDRLIMDLIREERLEYDGFELQDQACLMSDENRRTFLREWERHLAIPITLPSTGTRMPYRTALVQQTLHFARHVQDPKLVPYIGMHIA